MKCDFRFRSNCTVHRAFINKFVQTVFLAKKNDNDVLMGVTIILCYVMLCCFILWCSKKAKSYALLCWVMICYADLFYGQHLMLSMSKILWSVMLPLLRDYDWNICEQNLMHRYEFLFNEQNLIRPYEIDCFTLRSRIALNCVMAND